MSEKKFRYSDLQGVMANKDNFVLEVPAGITSKAELLRVLADAGCFPDYFGWNWDALVDCLCDLSWISEKQVVIFHRDLPVRGDLSECRIYLEILQTALDTWAQGTRENAIESKLDIARVDHRLIVVFPHEVKKILELICKDALIH
jgi:RNAse (barnase) inhibitor barstar